MNGLCNRNHLSLALVSAALLAFQIALLQILATSQWHHFAYLVFVQVGHEFCECLRIFKGHYALPDIGTLFSTL